MKKLIMACITIACLATQAKAQVSLLNLGGAFGPSGEYQFGIDKGSAVGGCVQRELANGQWLAGPCRDIFVLARNGVSVAHIGAAVMYNTEHGNANYDIRVGVNVGAATSAFLAKASQGVPYLSSLGNLHLPPALNYLANIMTVDYAVGWNPIHTPDVIGTFRHGPMFMLNIPLADVEALLPGNHL